VKLEWSAMALADLDRFAAFLHDRDPRLARIVAAEITQKAQVLLDRPELGKLIEGSQQYREVVLQVLNALYIFQYGYDGERLVMLRVFHGRESRERR
jgi:plasmid stabilization system protein ParE